MAAYIFAGHLCCFLLCTSMLGSPGTPDGRIRAHYYTDGFTAGAAIHDGLYPRAGFTVPGRLACREIPHYYHRRRHRRVARRELFVFCVYADHGSIYAYNNTGRAAYNTNYHGRSKSRFPDGRTPSAHIIIHHVYRRNYIKTTRVRVCVCNNFIRFIMNN